MDAKEKEYREQMQKALYSMVRAAGHDPDTIINDLRAKDCTPQLGVIYFLTIGWLWSQRNIFPDLSNVKAEFERAPDGSERIVLTLKSYEG